MSQQRRFCTERTMNGRIDCLQNAIDVLTDLVVPEADHAVAFA